MAIQAIDGNIVACGSQLIRDSTTQRLWIAKINANDQSTVWDYPFEFHVGNASAVPRYDFYDIIEDIDNIFVACGSSNRSGFIVKFNGSGNYLWDSQPLRALNINKIKVASDGNYSLLGGCFNNVICIVSSVFRLNPNGHLFFGFNIGDTDYPTMSFGFDTMQDGYLIGGRRLSYDCSKKTVDFISNLLVKYDFSGKMVFRSSKSKSTIQTVFISRDRAMRFILWKVTGFLPP